MQLHGRGGGSGLPVHGIMARRIGALTTTQTPMTLCLPNPLDPLSPNPRPSPCPNLL